MKQEIIYGTRAIIEAIDAGTAIERVMIQRDARNELLTELRKKIKANNISVANVPQQRLHKWKDKNHQGTIAFVSLVPFVELSDAIQQAYEKGEDPMIVLLDGVTDVRNFGAICRSAECMGVHGVVVPMKGTAMINDDAVKSSAGAIHHLNICKENNLSEAIRFMKDSGIKVFGLTEKTDTHIHDRDLSGPICLIAGSEEEGISDKIMNQCDGLLRLPMTGNIESLNVSVATGVGLYEVTRQRMQSS